MAQTVSHSTWSQSIRVCLLGGVERTCFVALAALLFACGGKAVIDGGGGGAAAAGGGSTGGSGGNPSCESISAQYADALAQAKTCDPFAKKLECTTEINSVLACGWPTYVNPANAQALDLLNELGTEWQKMGCVLPTPCPFGCPAPQGSSCVQGGGTGDSGHCEDSF
jgi:hypothetical protein